MRMFIQLCLLTILPTIRYSVANSDRPSIRDNHHRQEGREKRRGYPGRYGEEGEGEEEEGLVWEYSSSWIISSNGSSLRYDVPLYIQQRQHIF